MRLLLDTHIFLWFISADPRLPPRLRDQIRQPKNEVYLSTAAVWEAIVKYQLGKLALPESPDIYLPKQREKHRIGTVPIDEATVSHLAALPPVHRDPFDRMMVCQAIQHTLSLVTVDGHLQQYPIDVISA